MTLPKWPELPEWNPMNPQRSQAQSTAYHEDMSAAWEDRCRLAVKALRSIKEFDSPRTFAHMEATKVIAEIGDLPEVK